MATSHASGVRTARHRNRLPPAAGDSPREDNPDSAARGSPGTTDGEPTAVRRPAPSEPGGPAARLARDRFGLLLVLLTASYIAGGLRPWWVERVIAGALELAALVLTVLATGVIRDRRAQLGLAAAGLGAFGVVSASSTQGTAFGVASLVGAGVFTAMFVAVMARVLRQRTVTLQTLFAAVCAYELLGFLFAGIYGGFGGLGPRPFFGQPVDRATYSYFSFVTLTTVGFGDYTSRGELARRFVAIEALIGQVFIATTLARLVALYRGPSRAGPDASDEPSGDGTDP